MLLQLNETNEVEHQFVSQENDRYKQEQYKTEDIDQDYDRQRVEFYNRITIVFEHRHNGQVRAKQRDRHLLKMVIVEVILNVIVSIPYSINLLYGALTHLTSKNARRLEIESFITFLTTFSIYLISITPFYLFVFTSKSFRKNFIALAVSFWYKYILRQAHVAPVTEHRITPTVHQMPFNSKIKI